MIKGVILTFPIGGLVNWEMRIRLTPRGLSTLERIAGPTLDERYLPHDESDIRLIQDKETWAWFLGDQFGDEKTVRIWFRDPRAAAHFKLAWQA